MHAVIALVLGVVWQRGRGRPSVLRVVQIEILRLVLNREVENICGILTRAAHVGLIGVWIEPLRPSVPAAGLGGVHHGERAAAIRRRPHAVEVDGDIRHHRLPRQLQQQGRIVERACRSVYDMTADTAVLAR